MLDKSKVEKIPVVILAGGLGTRIADVKKRIPKGLVKIGEYPIIHHVIKIFKYYGYKKFIICTGYKKNEIKKYFYNNKKSQTYKDLDIDIFFTGLNSNIGLRIKKIKIKSLYSNKKCIKDFCCNYEIN